MKFQLLSALLVAATSVTAQQSIPFTHPQTGLRFQALTHPSSQSSFGIALPPVGGPTNEFIGQISARLNSGWYGVSLGGGMLNNLLIAAWQNGNNIVSSFRLTGSYGSPATYTRAGPTITPICTSYQTNSTHWTFTFVCKDCNAWTLSSGQQTKIDLAGDFQVMGYAGHTSSKPSQPAQPGSSVPKHTYQGQFGMNLQAARSSDYDAFKRCERGTGGGPSSSSTTTTKTTTTTSSTPTPTETPQPKWAQCGGTWWTGSKTCVAGTKCVFINDGYSQCQ